MSRRLIAILVLTICLSGCVGAFLAGAATGGLIVYDRRNLQTVSDDQHIRYRAQKNIAEDANMKDTHISVASFHYNLLLVGQSPTASQRANAERIARSIGGVKRIYNEITIAPATPPGIRSNDAWITTKVKAQLLGANGLHSGEIKVVTENSTVYLMGRVSKAQSQIAVDETRKVIGVKRIVKVFQYV